MSSPSERVIKKAKKSKTQTEKAPAVQFTATNADANKKSSGKTEDVPRKKVKTSHEDSQANFGISQYLNSSAKIALGHAERTGRVLRAIAGGLDETEKTLMSPGQEADHAEFARIVQVFCEYLNMKLVFKSPDEIEMTTADPTLPESVALPDSETLCESDSNTSDTSSEDSASEKTASETSEASESESGSDSNNNNASAHKSGSGENDSGSDASGSDNESSSDSESDSDAEMVGAVQELPVAPVPATKDAKKPTKVAQEPIKAVKAPERTPVKVRGKTTKQQQSEGVQKTGKELPSWLTQKPTTHEPAVKAAQTTKQQPPKIIRSVESKAPIAPLPRRQSSGAGYMEPPLRPPPDATRQFPTERGTGLNTVDHGPWGVLPTIQVSKEPVKRNKPKKVTKAAPKVPPTPDWHKKDASTTPQATEVSQPVRQSTTPIPLPKTVQHLMKASQPTSTKPAQPVQAKASQAAPTKPAEPVGTKKSEAAAPKPTQPLEAKKSEAAAPKASKSKKAKKKSRASKKSEEVATTAAKKPIIPKVESSDGEQSPLEIMKPMSLPAQPAKQYKSPHRGPAYYDLFDMTDSEVN